jgi:hypothetical protein
MTCVVTHFLLLCYPFFLHTQPIVTYFTTLTTPGDLFIYHSSSLCNIHPSYIRSPSYRPTSARLYKPRSSSVCVNITVSCSVSAFWTQMTFGHFVATHLQRCSVWDTGWTIRGSVPANGRDFYLFQNIRLSLRRTHLPVRFGG